MGFFLEYNNEFVEFYIFDVLESTTVIFLMLNEFDNLWSVEALSSWLLRLFDVSSVVFDSVLAFWYDKMPQSHLEHFLL